MLKQGICNKLLQLTTVKNGHNKVFNERFQSNIARNYSNKLFQWAIAINHSNKICRKILGIKNSIAFWKKSLALKYFLNEWQYLTHALLYFLNFFVLPLTLFLNVQEILGHKCFCKKHSFSGWIPKPLIFLTEWLECMARLCWFKILGIFFINKFMLKEVSLLFRPFHNVKTIEILIYFYA